MEPAGECPPDVLRLVDIDPPEVGADDVRLPFPPAWMQRLGLALGAPLGRLLGYDATYVPSGADAALETSG